MINNAFTLLTNEIAIILAPSHDIQLILVGENSKSCPIIVSQ
jgi:hypothetical protein